MVNYNYARNGVGSGATPSFEYIEYKCGIKLTIFKCSVSKSAS